MFDLENYEIAEESFFSDPEVSIDMMMDKLKAGLIANNATPEKCDELLAKIQDEAVKFNDLIRQMSNAVHEFEAHNMDKEEFLAFMKPLCNDLHNNCTALSLVKCDNDDGCIDNENELAVLREFLVKSAAAVAELKDELTHAPGADSPADKGVIGDDIASVAEALEAMLADDGTDTVLDDEDEDEDYDDAEECGIATEGVRAWLKGRKENKAAIKAKVGELRTMPASKIPALAVKAISGNKGGLVLGKGPEAEKLINEEYDRFERSKKGTETNTKVKSSGYPMILTSKDSQFTHVTVVVVTGNDSYDIDTWNAKTLAGLLTQGQSAPASEGYIILDDDFATESSGMSFIDDIINGEIATEGSDMRLAHQYRKSTKAKTAAALYKQAVKLKGLGSIEKAISTMQQAQRIYETLAKDAAKVFRTYKADVSHGISADDHVNSMTEKYGEYRKNVDRGSSSFYSTVTYLQDRADACKACIMKWKNKNEKKSVAELKATLKAERKAERARLKEERKASKGKAAAAATESFDIDNDDDLEELALEAEMSVMAAEDGFDDFDDEV